VGDVRRAVGDAGEEAAAQWYLARGFRVRDRNWRVREGELDLVVQRGATLVFCEVKTRRGAGFGAPAEAVTPRKQARIRALARMWLADHDERADVVRFDVAAVTPDGRGWSVEVFAAAF